MPLSTNTLIHFTKDKAVLKKILEENFRVFYCRESVILGGKSRSFHVPMVSFCDIPLSEIKDHIGKYGSYGLGMTREWGVRNGLNPVLYISQASTLSESYRYVFNKLIVGTEVFSDEQKAILDLLRYMKNYEAPLERKGQVIPDYRFSDEREWRYVPPYTENFSMLVSSSYYDENEDRFSKVLDGIRLSFGPNDIKYIVINDDSEIGEFVQFIRQVKGGDYPLHDIDRLTTRILTSEQIREDV